MILEPFLDFIKYGGARTPIVKFESKVDIAAGGLFQKGQIRRELCFAVKIVASLDISSASHGRNA